MKMFRYELNRKYYEDEEIGLVFADSEYDALRVISKEWGCKPCDIDMNFTEISADISNKMFDMETIRFMCK